MSGIVERLTEGIVNRDMRAEGHALLTKWERTGLLEGLFYISGSFTDPNPANRSTGYGAVLQGPGGREVEMTVEDTTGILFTSLETVGVYTLNVKALGNGGAKGFEENAYFDSQYSTIPVLLIPQEIGANVTQIETVEILPNF